MAAQSKTGRRYIRILQMLEQHDELCAREIKEQCDDWSRQQIASTLRHLDELFGLESRMNGREKYWRLPDDSDDSPDQDLHRATLEYIAGLDNSEMRSPRAKLIEAVDAAREALEGSGGDVDATCGGAAELLNDVESRWQQRSLSDCTDLLWAAFKKFKRLDVTEAVNIKMVRYLVARSRQIQEMMSPYQSRDAIGTLHRALTSYTYDEVDGYVHGLARDHDPVHGSWRQDAEAAARELRGLVDDSEAARQEAR